MVTGPRDLSGDPGLAPASPPGDPVPVDHVAVDVLEHLPHDVMALVVGPCMDRIAALARSGASDPVLRTLRTQVRVMIRGLYECEMRRAGLLQRVDFDPTTR